MVTDFGDAALGGVTRLNFKMKAQSDLGYPATMGAGTYPDKRFVRIWE